MVVSIQAASPARRAHDLYSKSVQLDIGDVAADLQQHLGHDLLAVIVNKDVRTLTRWSSGTAHPPGAEEKLLRDAYLVLEVLLTLEESSVSRAWFMGMNPQLDDASPAEALAAGQAWLVLAAARSYIDAG